MAPRPVLRRSDPASCARYSPPDSSSTPPGGPCHSLRISWRSPIGFLTSWRVRALLDDGSARLQGSVFALSPMEIPMRRTPRRPQFGRWLLLWAALVALAPAAGARAQADKADAAKTKSGIELVGRSDKE